jgi:hypothetical protein
MAQDFVPVELCNLDYCPTRGAAIAPHKDDSWLWGERLVTLTLLCGTMLTFSDGNGIAIKVPLPRRSLVVVSGAARLKEQRVSLFLESFVFNEKVLAGMRGTMPYCGKT